MTVYIVEARAMLQSGQWASGWMTVSRPSTRERAVADAEAVEDLGDMRARIREEVV